MCMIRCCSFLPNGLVLIRASCVTGCGMCFHVAKEGVLLGTLFIEEET